MGRYNDDKSQLKLLDSVSNQSQAPTWIQKHCIHAIIHEKSESHSEKYTYQEYPQPQIPRIHQNPA